MNGQEVVIDTSIFVALWHPDSPVYQSIHSRDFFEKTETCLFGLLVCEELVFGEINKKFGKKLKILVENFLNLKRKLSKIGKWENLKIKKEDKNEINKLKKKSLEQNYDLSYVDCVLAYLAKINNKILLSFDENLIDFCYENNINAAYPQEITKF